MYGWPVEAVTVAAPAAAAGAVTVATAVTDAAPATAAMPVPGGMTAGGGGGGCCRRRNRRCHVRPGRAGPSPAAAGAAPAPALTSTPTAPYQSPAVSVQSRVTDPPAALSTPQALPTAELVNALMTHRLVDPAPAAIVAAPNEHAPVTMFPAVVPVTVTDPAVTTPTAEAGAVTAVPNGADVSAPA